MVRPLGQAIRCRRRDTSQKQSRSVAVEDQSMELMQRNRRVARCLAGYAAALLCTGMFILPGCYLKPASVAGDGQVHGEYAFFPCDTPVKVTVEGMPAVDGFRSQSVSNSCGSGARVRLDPPDREIESDPRWIASRDRMPTLSVNERDGGFDIEVVWAAATPAIRYRAERLAARTPSILLVPDAEGGPILRLSLEPLNEKPHVGIRADHVKVPRVLRDLSHSKHLTFRNGLLLRNATVSFTFDHLDVPNLVRLLADAGNVLSRREGPSAYAFGETANAARIGVLYDERFALPPEADDARRKALFEEIVALSSPETPEQFPTPVDSELLELARFAIRDGDYAGAMSLLRARSAQIDFFGYDQDEGSVTASAARPSP